MAPYAVNTLKLILITEYSTFWLPLPKILTILKNLSGLLHLWELKKHYPPYICHVWTRYQKSRQAGRYFPTEQRTKGTSSGAKQSKIIKNSFKDSVSINRAVYLYGKDVCRDKWLCLNLDNTNEEKTKDILNTLDSMNIPFFPLNGKDLIQIGADQKLIGLYIDALKKDWYEHGCCLSKEELIRKYKEIF